MHSHQMEYKPYETDTNQNKGVSIRSHLMTSLKTMHTQYLYDMMHGTSTFETTSYFLDTQAHFETPTLVYCFLALVEHGMWPCIFSVLPP